MYNSLECVVKVMCGNLLQGAWSQGLHLHHILEDQKMTLHSLLPTLILGLEKQEVESLQLQPLTQNLLSLLPSLILDLED